MLANLGAPGLGQLYSGSWRRAVMIYMIALSAFPIASLTRLTYIFSTMVILVILTLAFFIWMSVDGSKQSVELGPFALPSFRFDRWFTSIN